MTQTPNVEVRQPVALPIPAVESPPRHPREGPSPKVLVADDDPVALEFTTELLSDCGYDVMRVTNGTDALKYLEAEDGPSLAVLDWVMPDVDGTDVCRRIRAAQNSRYIYMILVTARDDPKAVVEALGAGADDCVRKPFNPQELRARLDAGSRIMVQRALQESEERFQSAFEYAGVGMAIAQLSGRFLQVNQALCDFLGYAKQDFLTKTLREITCLKDDAETEFGLQQLACGSLKTYQAEERCLHKNGHTVWGHIALSLVRNADGKPTAFFAQVHDVTERRRLEEQLRQAQKLEAIGQLAAGISHEINTPTQYVGDNTRFVKDSWSAIHEVISMARQIHAESTTGSVSQESLARLGASMQKQDLDYLLAEIPRAIEQSLDGVQRVAKIVRAMKEFSHPGSEEKQPIDINHAIQTTITVARSEWKYVADIETRLQPNLALVPCHAGGFNQVILNLLINAAHAIKDVVGDGSERKGRILITTRQDGDWVEISVQDTGTGMPDAIRTRIFEPFFTTKPVGKGTGQGLALAHSTIVREHGGRLWFETEIGKSTTFFIRLPLVLAAAE